MRVSGLILLVWLIPLAALPAVAGSVSFSLNMTGEYEIVPGKGKVTLLFVP